MKELSLYKLSEEEMRIEQAIADGEGELTPELEKAMNEVGAAIAKKVDSYRHILVRLEGDLASARAEKDRIVRFIRTGENGQRRLKENLLSYMTSHGISRLDGEFCTVSIRASPARAVFEEDKLLAPFMGMADDFVCKLPPYVKMEMKVDRTELKKAIERGEQVAATLVQENSIIFK